MLRHCGTILMLVMTMTVHGQGLPDIEKRLRLLENLAEFGRMDKIKYDTAGFSELPLSDYFCDDENENTWDYYHVVDLNNDGLKDLLYSGPCMPYSQTGVFLNKGDSLDLVHSYPGEVLSIDKRKDKTILNILKWPCCCDIYFDYYEIIIHNSSQVDKNVIVFQDVTKIIVDKLKEIKVSGVLRTTGKIDDKEREDDCLDEIVKGNHLTEISKTTKAIELYQDERWRLILYNENKTNAYIGWLKK